jgi:hypothetical protein
LTVVVPPSVPPVPDWIATVTAAVDAVTVFPCASWIVTTGCVASAAPDAPAYRRRRHRQLRCRSRRHRQIARVCIRQTR